MLFETQPVVVRGGGDLASGVVYRLVKAGFPVVIFELSKPLLIRRTVAYGSAVFEEQITVDGLTARLVEQPSEVRTMWAAGQIPVLVDPDAKSLPDLNPMILVDARIAKRNLGTNLHDAPLVIALGPGYEAGNDCHAVIETNRGHNLGRVIWQGTAEPNTGQPGSVRGRVGDRVLRAPADGYAAPHAAIGDRLIEGSLVATVDDHPVIAPFDGVLRGLIHPSVPVTSGMKIGDLDPRGERSFCFTISDKSLAIGGGVVEAILSAPQVVEHLRKPFN